jgi:hypothetical protein
MPDERRRAAEERWSADRRGNGEDRRLGGGAMMSDRRTRFSIVYFLAVLGLLLALTPRV